MTPVYKIVPADEHQEEDKFLNNPIDRVEEEFAGWCDYRKLFHATNQERYRTASKQEFGHLLMAIEDFFDEIMKQDPDAEELREFNRMISNVISAQHTAM